MALSAPEVIKTPRLTEVETAQESYQVTFAQLSSRLCFLKNRLGKCIQVARPFYESQDRKGELLQQIKAAVSRYEMLNDQLNALRENVSSLEKAASSGTVESFLLDELNAATSQVNYKQCEVTKAKAEHERLLDSYKHLELLTTNISRKHPLNITRARPYFLARKRFNQAMEEAKLHVETCTEKVGICKAMYSDAMTRLEHLSDIVHHERLQLKQVSEPQDEDVETPPTEERGECVGAESSSPSSDGEYPCQMPHPDATISSPMVRSISECPVGFVKPQLNGDSGLVQVQTSNLPPSGENPLLEAFLEHFHDAEQELESYKCGQLDLVQIHQMLDSSQMHESSGSLKLNPSSDPVLGSRSTVASHSNTSMGSSSIISEVLPDALSSLLTIGDTNSSPTLNDSSI